MSERSPSFLSEEVTPDKAPENSIGDSEGSKFLNKFAARIFGNMDRLANGFDQHKTEVEIWFKDTKIHLLEQDQRLERIEQLQIKTNGRILEAEKVTKPLGWASHFIYRHFPNWRSQL